MGKHSKATSKTACILCQNDPCNCADATRQGKHRKPGH